MLYLLDFKKILTDLMIKHFDDFDKKDAKKIILTTRKVFMFMQKRKNSNN